MKVRHLIEGGKLDISRTYNVFCYQEWEGDESKIYISDYDESGRYYLQLFDLNEFEIIDGSISRFWHFGINQFGEKTIGIPELWEENNFWERYYDDDKISKILEIYYKIGKTELFNT